MRLEAYISAVVLLSSTFIHAADNVVCDNKVTTENNCYRLYKPAGRPRGLVVMLPYYGSDANEFSSADLPRLLIRENVATMVVSAAGYLSDEDVAVLAGWIRIAARELQIPPRSLVVGGISAGGTGAVRYYEHCARQHCDEFTSPVAIFSVDAPLDFESWWNRQTLNLRRGDPKSFTGESEAVQGAMRAVLGGSPSEVHDVYRARSPFLVSEKDGGNAVLLKTVPIRLYTEPDVVWLVENWGLDYYTINAPDQAALVLQLRALGNKEADLITTSGKGYRPAGKRNPHSWTIVDEPDLAHWILARLGR